jgi:4-hydroxy-3-methylbut-2-enyl diphosphate reductase
VHIEAARHHEEGLQILLIGHASHPEVVGTMGQLPEGAVTLIETTEDAQRFVPYDTGKLAFVTQTTLSVDDTAAIVAVLRARFPAIVGPHKEDICYATTNRQAAVKAIAPKIGCLLVVGSPQSSNSLRLVEVALRAGCPTARLIEGARDIPWADIEGIESVGVTAGASAPETLVEAVIDAFRGRFDVKLETITTALERIAFNVPRELRPATPVS